MARGFGARETQEYRGLNESSAGRPRRFFEKLNKGIGDAVKRLEELKGTGRTFDIEKALYELERLGLELVRYKEMRAGFGASEERSKEEKDSLKEAIKTYDRWKREQDKTTEGLAEEMGISVKEATEAKISTIASSVDELDKKFGEISKSPYRLAKTLDAVNKMPKETGARLAAVFAGTTARDGKPRDDLKRAVVDGKFSKKGGMTLNQAYDAVAAATNTLPGGMANPRRAVLNMVKELNRTLEQGGVAPASRARLLQRATVSANFLLSAADDEARKQILRDAGFDA